MPWLTLLLALSAAGPPPGAAAPGALGALAEGVAGRLGGPEEGRRGLALALSAEPAALRAPLAAALAGALGQAGWSVSAVAPGPAAEAAARAAGADWLLALTAGGDGGELVAVGEATPLWASFFLQARPGVRSAPPRLVSARAPADPEARLLLGRSGPPPAPRYALRPFATLPGQALALAVGAVDGAAPVVLVVSGVAVRLLDRTGAEVASHPLDPAARRPLRAPMATAVVAPLGGGPFGVALAGATGGEVFALRGARLERAASLPMAPLAAGEAGVLFGAFAPGRAALQDLLVVGADPEARPRSPRDLLAVAAAPRRSTPAFAALHPGGRLELLDAALGPAGAVDAVGAGVALADLDGDGRSEVVASLQGPGSPDRVRVLKLAAAPAPGADPAVAFESPPLEGAVTAAAAGDLTGDGLDDVLLAAVRLVAGQPASTDLWLLTLDPREAR